MKLINRNNLLLTKFVAKDESRYTTNAILITENETVGTDGHILARVSLPDRKPQDFPVVEGFIPNGFKQALLPAKTAVELEKSIPKKPTYPILENAAITTHENKIQVAVTDLESPKVLTVRQVEGSFPNWEAVFPTQKPTMDITLNADLLRRVADVVCKFSDTDHKGIRLRFTGNDRAVRFDAVNSDGQEINGLIMPLRSGKNGDETVKPTFKVWQDDPITDSNPQ